MTRSIYWNIRRYSTTCAWPSRRVDALEKGEETSPCAVCASLRSMRTPVRSRKGPTRRRAGTPTFLGWPALSLRTEERREQDRQLEHRDAKCAPGALRADAREPYVFCNRKGKPFRSIRNAFNRAPTKAGLGDDVTPHVLRHTFASRLAMVGEGWTVQELGGWKRLSLSSATPTSHRATRRKPSRKSRERTLRQIPQRYPNTQKGAASA
jgi:hypothetical protein